MNPRNGTINIKRIGARLDKVLRLAKDDSQPRVCFWIITTHMDRLPTWQDNVHAEGVLADVGSSETPHDMRMVLHESVSPTLKESADSLGTMLRWSDLRLGARRRALRRMSEHFENGKKIDMVGKNMEDTKSTTPEARSRKLVHPLRWA